MFESRRVVSGQPALLTNAHHDTPGTSRHQALLEAEEVFSALLSLSAPLEFRARSRWIAKSSGKGVDLAIHAEQLCMDSKSRRLTNAEM